ncbi:MarR family winged helix-turn-helix transcriptional regulator [Altererythrobacter lauratis]|uniref:MarR family winged helix-turn-helix transcriptional regulator n=1 Tax=Alteraurantiacibacter lauratis TaxID=2054627 RepID=A0ABV7EKI9_9SPHN
MKDDFDEWNSLYNRFYPEGSRSDLEFRTTRLLVLAGRAYVSRIDKLLVRKTGQSRVRWQILFALAFAPQPATLTDVARRAYLKWPSMVKLVDEMVREGLLQRQDNPADGRSKLISLTDAGEAMVRTIQPVKDSERAAVLQHLSDEELAQTVRLLGKLFEAIGEPG